MRSIHPRLSGGAQETGELPPLEGPWGRGDGGPGSPEGSSHGNEHSDDMIYSKLSVDSVPASGDRWGLPRCPGPASKWDLVSREERATVLLGSSRRDPSPGRTSSEPPPASGPDVSTARGRAQTGTRPSVSQAWKVCDTLWLCQTSGFSGALESCEEKGRQQ